MAPAGKSAGTSTGLTAFWASPGFLGGASPEAALNTRPALKSTKRRPASNWDFMKLLLAWTGFQPARNMGRLKTGPTVIRRASCS